MGAWVFGVCGLGCEGVLFLVVGLVVGDFEVAGDGGGVGEVYLDVEGDGVGFVYFDCLGVLPAMGDVVGFGEGDGVVSDFGGCLDVVVHFLWSFLVFFFLV